MIAVVRMTVLHMRTVAPYRTQGLLAFGLLMLILGRNPDRAVPALAMLLAPLIAMQPFAVADKTDLPMLYAVLPVRRRAVLLGYYTWALAGYLATVIAGAALSVLLARAEGAPFGGRDLTTMVTLSWALFCLNVAIQFPLLIRFGYARISVLGTTMPLALVMLAIYRLHLTITSLQPWLPLIWAAGAAAMAASAAVATRNKPAKR